MPPRAADREGVRHPTSFRVTTELKDKLEDAASKLGRSLSQEIEQRLELSFVWEQAHRDVQTLLAKAKDAVTGGLDARHFEAGHDKVRTSAGKVWAEPGALDAFLASFLEPAVNRAVAEALKAARI